MPDFVSVVRDPTLSVVASLVRVFAAQRFSVECHAVGVLGMFLLLCYGMCNRSFAVRSVWSSQVVDSFNY